ncbi:MAG: hypothetical protein VKI82_07320 [Leptolyngbya sp.]|nr:hypothetical protein [Leptolyngbya sp.]
MALTPAAARDRLTRDEPHGAHPSSDPGRRHDPRETIWLEDPKTVFIVGSAPLSSRNIASFDQNLLHISGLRSITVLSARIRLESYSPSPDSPAVQGGPPQGSTRAHMAVKVASGSAVSAVGGWHSGWG